MKVKEINSKARKITIEKEGKEVARVFIFLINNDLGHHAPYALLEDVYVEEEYRGEGYGKDIVQAAIEEAKRLGCYKIVGFSRYSREKVHSFYLKMGFEDWGKEFRMNLE